MKLIFLFTFILFVGFSYSACILGTQTGCNTAIAQNISSQIVKEMQRMGYSFAALNTQWIKCTTPCIAELQTGAANSLLAAAKAKNDFITLNSAFRSSAQQYLLYNWYLKKICSITLAAKPGTSNHEGGRAIDTSNYNYWLSSLQAQGWVHSYPTSDPVHFDYPKVTDLAKQNLIAFQRLWNSHNPTKKISEDGIYGPATADAFYNTPCTGW
eukprot:TRINITY_DN3307_c0_g1_i1.p1 TRINITY_DN3307_c0_g1~~TRINITY_DN3307_c0_g1_i1.p1  ORF type:complete len:212 (+),score=53.00 TRINITY_DN3307_c0_g1_i1:1-636(+)